MDKIPTAIAVVPGYYLVCYNTNNGNTTISRAVVPGYYLVCYNLSDGSISCNMAVVPGYYLVCYNTEEELKDLPFAVVPGYYLVCYNGNGEPCIIQMIMQGSIFQKANKNDYNRWKKHILRKNQEI